MRSRYAAYALGLVDYVVITTDPDGPARGDLPQSEWREGITQFCAHTRFTALHTEPPDIDGDRATVLFRAGLTQQGHDASFTERSTFVLRDGRWLYHSGERVTMHQST
jgi:SEC-C motif-containing protein